MDCLDPNPKASGKMKPYLAWIPRPIFVSSTFRDMHAERDYLQRHVYPRLEERLRERKLLLEPIDLRIGVETASLDDIVKKELLVLRVCLNEIVRSRPFLIVLLGDRYGWVPPLDRARAAVAEVGFFEGVVEGKSVTALEIEFGVLSQPEQLTRTHFFLRHLDSTGMDDAVAAAYRDPDPQSVAKLSALKDRIRSQVPDRVHDFAAQWDPETQKVVGIEQIGEEIFQAIWTDLDEATRERAIAPESARWEEREAARLDSFMIDASRDFRGRDALLNEIEQHLIGSHEPLSGCGICLVGEPGSGKSSVFARLVQRIRNIQSSGSAGGNPPVMLAHAAGISDRSIRVDDVLRRWIFELDQFLGEDSALSAEAATATIRRIFDQDLRKAADRSRVVFLVDAVDQLEPTGEAQFLAFLPEPWPQNVRMFCTRTITERAEMLLLRSGGQVRQLEPIGPAEAPAIIEAIANRYHRTFGTPVVEAIVNKRRDDGSLSCGNPLWLNLACEHLNLLDADDFARANATDREARLSIAEDERLERMLCDLVAAMPADVDGLYTWLLERIAEIVGHPIADAFASLIAASRHGLRESDLAVLLPRLSGENWIPLDFAVLRRSFRAHLVRRGEHCQWDFHHRQMRVAIHRHLLHDGERLQKVHREIATHLESLPGSDPLRRAETLLHWLQARDRRRASRYYTRIPDPDTLIDLPAHVRELLGDHGDELRLATDSVVEFLLAERDAAERELTDADKESRVQFVFSLLPTVEEQISPAPGPNDRVIESEGCVMIQWAEPPPSELDVMVLSAKFSVQLADALRAAAPALARRLAVHVRSATLLFEHNPMFVGSRSFAALGRFRVGEAAREQGDLRSALESFLAGDRIFAEEASLGAGSANATRNLAVSREKLGEIYHGMGSLESALECFQQSAQLRKSLDEQGEFDRHPDWQRDLTVIYGRLGGVQSAQEHFEAALANYESALASSRRFAGHPEALHDQMVCLENCSRTLLALNRPQEGLDALKAYVNVVQAISARDPGNDRWRQTALEGQGRVGDLLFQLGEVQAAIEVFRNMVAPIQQRLLVERDSPNWNHFFFALLFRISECQQALGQQAEMQRTLRNLHVVLATMRLNSVEMSASMRECLDHFDATNGAISFFE